MSSDKVCCVPGCKESGGMHAVLHGFPHPEKDRNRFNSWLYAIGGNIIGLENERIYKYRRVCHSHFADKYKCWNNRISNIAVPTLNMPDPITQLKFTFSERKPMHQITNIVMDTSELFSEPKKMVHVEESESNPADMEVMEILPSNLQGITKTYRTPKMKKMVHEVVMNPNPGTLEATQVLPSTSREILSTLQTPELKKIVPEEVSVPNLPHTIEVIQVLPSTSQEIQSSLQKSIQQPRTKRSRRIFYTEKEMELRKQILGAKIRISKLKNKNKMYLAEIKAAKKISSNPIFCKAIESCSSTSKLLMAIQLRENRKKSKGRRFTLQEKIVALSLLKQSPRGYKFFRNFFILPAPQTLIKLVHNINIKTGINAKIFSQLTKKALTMKNEEKLCILLFDEISLKAYLNYNEKKDKVIGFIDNGAERKPDFADHAQVFMVRGLIKNYKQPVAYTFSASATKGPELAKQIKHVIQEILKAGLIVVGTVCDQGTNNRSALKLLLDETRGIYLRRGEDPKKNTILINDEEIIPIYDPPHLLKGMRNNLMSKNLEYNLKGVKQIAKWSHLQQLYKENPGYKGIRLIPKLTEYHVNPEKMNKMKVKYASQIFSRTVASNMGYLADKGILPSESKDTADLLLFIDNLFDSTNGSYKKNNNAKPLLGPATPGLIHLKTWAEAKKVFKTMTFLTTGAKHETVPTISNWVWTLESIEILLKNVNEKFGVKSVWLRHLNQDPLENFFGAVRSHGCRNVNPTCDQFEHAFATLLINNLASVHTQGKNCENDFCEALHSLVVDSCEPTSSSTSVDVGNILDINITPIQEKEKNPKIIAPLQYISGYILKKVKNNVFKNCKQCKEDFIDKNEVEYIKYREYAGRRWLCYPSKDLIIVISSMQDVVHEILKSRLESIHLAEIVKTAMLVLIDFRFIKCKEHKESLVQYLTKFVTKFLIYTKCKNINKILTGRREIDDDEDIFQVKARKYHKKCFKRKK